MKMRRLLACIMALLLSASLPVSALADTYDLAEGSVSVNASESGQTVTHKEETRPDSAPVITQSGSSETATAHTVTIEAGAGSTANVTLDGVNISADGAAIQTSGSGDVVIELDGENTVQSGEGHAGVEKDNNGSLTITDKNGEAGSLEATGGALGAGIGGGVVFVGNGSNIAISGGTVVAKGGAGGAGIGGGVARGGSEITISGGTVEATGGAGGAGIGGGYGSSGSEITISGGSVKATGGDALNKGSGDKIEKGEGGGAGIGGGAGGDGSDITISGGTVAANGGENAAGIGGGAGGDGSDITISGGTVAANGGDNAAGIGGGAGGISSNITIIGGSVNAQGGESGSGSYNPDANDGDADETDDGYPDSSTGHKLDNEYAKVLREVLKLTNSNGQNFPCEPLVKGNEFIFTVAANSAILTGERDDLKDLTDQGIRKTVLETNRVSVSVSNDLLMEITNDNESFQLRTEGTSVRLTTTDQNHKKKFDMTLTTDGTQEEQQETQKDTQGMFAYELDVSQPPNDDSLNRLLHLISTSDKATLTSTGGTFQTLSDRGIVQTVLSTNGITTSIDHKRVLETAKISDSLELTHNGNNAIFKFNGIVTPTVVSATFKD